MEHPDRHVMIQLPASCEGVDATPAEIESEMKDKDCLICYTARIAMRTPRDESKRRYENLGDSGCGEFAPTMGSSKQPSISTLSKKV